MPVAAAISLTSAAARLLTVMVAVSALFVMAERSRCAEAGPDAHYAQVLHHDTEDLASRQGIEPQPAERRARPRCEADDGPIVVPWLEPSADHDHVARHE